MMKRLGKLCVAMLALVASVANATTLRRMNLEELAAASAAVVRARCVGSESRWEDGRIWTFSEFEIVESLKGSAAAAVRVRLIGGRTGSFTSHVEGVPRFRTGDEAYLFLAPAASGEWTVTGWALGTFRVARDQRTTEETVTQDAAGVTLFDPATRRFEPGGVRHMPVEEFRSRVARAVARGGVAR